MHCLKKKQPSPFLFVKAWFLVQDVFKCGEGSMWLSWHKHSIILGVSQLSQSYSNVFILVDNHVLLKNVTPSISSSLSLGIQYLMPFSMWTLLGQWPSVSFHRLYFLCAGVSPYGGNVTARKTALMVLMNQTCAHTASAVWDSSSAGMATARAPRLCAMLARIVLMALMKTVFSVVRWVPFHSLLCLFL